MCSTMPTHLGLFRNWPNFYSTLVWDCKQGKTIWILHATSLMKYHSLQESLLDTAQSGKQEPACTQQLTLFLRGYDISHDVSLTSRTQTPLLPSLLPSLGAGSPRDAVPPSFTTAPREHYYKTASRSVIPSLNCMGTASCGETTVPGQADHSFLVVQLHTKTHQEPRVT